MKPRARLHHFTFRTNIYIAEWLVKFENRSDVINDALKRYQTNTEWRESENEYLRDLVREFGRIGGNINQIARTLHVSEMRGEKPEGLEYLFESGGELRKAQAKLEKIIRAWNW